MDENKPKTESQEYHDEMDAGTAGGIISEYIVEERDTLPDIARKNGISIEEILHANRGIAHNIEDLVKPGMKIMIPKKIH